MPDLIWTDPEMEKLHDRIRDEIRHHLDLPESLALNPQLPVPTSRQRQEFDSWVAVKLEQTRPLRELAAALKTLYTQPAPQPRLDTDVWVVLEERWTGVTRMTKVKLSEFGKTWKVDDQGFAALLTPPNSEPTPPHPRD